MSDKLKRIVRYWPQYKFSNIFKMVRNSFQKPLIFPDDFNGKNVIITGATSGIGYETALKYASHGANILSINRNKEKSEALCERITKEYRVNCDYITADLSRLHDIHQVAEKLLTSAQSIDVFIHNAGIYLTKRTLTEDGLETTFVVNYLSSFILNHKLKEKLKAQGHGRIILNNSEAHRFTVWGIRLDDLHFHHRRYTGLKAYAQAKTAQLLTMMMFAEYFEGSGVTINAMHPGMVATDSGKDNGKIYKWFKKNVLDKLSQSAHLSAEAMYYLGTSPDLQFINGKFFHLTTLEEPAPPALDREVAQKLWDISLTMGKL